MLILLRNLCPYTFCVTRVDNFILTPFFFLSRDLDLKRPMYQKTAAYGHFGRDGFSWECAKKLNLEIA